MFNRNYNNNRNRNVKFAPIVSDVVNDSDNLRSVPVSVAVSVALVSALVVPVTLVVAIPAALVVAVFVVLCSFFFCDNYLGEKATTNAATTNTSLTPNETNTSHDIPVFEYNLVKPHRNMFVDERTIQQKIVSLNKDRKEIDDKIVVLKKQMANGKVKTTGNGLKWVYKSDKPRTKYFDEREHYDGSSSRTPRVVTVVWTFNNATNVVRYGAVIWTQGHSGDNFSKYEQRMFATKRYMSNPVIVRLSVVPETDYEFIKCLRSMVHVLGVECTSKKFQNGSGNGNGYESLKTHKTFHPCFKNEQE